jgi:hypothetical protein
MIRIGKVMITTLSCEAGRFVPELRIYFRQDNLHFGIRIIEKYRGASESLS